MIQDCEDYSKKRKRDESLQPDDFLYNSASPHLNYSKRLVLDTELHFDTPMPLEWQRCLDIESGQIHYYNTKTHKKTLADPRSSSPEPPRNIGLDLELNLPCGPSKTTKKHHVADNFSKFKTSGNTLNINIGSGARGGSAPPWLVLEEEDQQQEMMTTVCRKCHMLVMMFKISPSCPNCKFMHPPNLTTPSLFNRELSLLC
ncbi:hypothetical protein R6Q59_019565 [Mikania micrantha]|uniref:WW domain-containing protein n=1 Tax=Mikania micrantha TaxID=192012 RepID=A0A5N6LC95_9ASTR|nr:hypothetical protein E3N88_44574 [Mikania micrantha]